jgi:Helicase associated domain.
MQNTWLERYQALKEFHSKYGHCRVTKTYEDQVLYRWVTKERMKYRNYLAGEKPCQTTEQWTLLEKLDFMEGNKISVVPKNENWTWKDHLSWSK